MWPFKKRVMPAPTAPTVRVGEVYRLARDEGNPFFAQEKEIRAVITDVQGDWLQYRWEDVIDGRYSDPVRNFLERYKLVGICASGSDCDHVGHEPV